MRKSTLDSLLVILKKNKKNKRFQSSSSLMKKIKRKSKIKITSIITEITTITMQFSCVISHLRLLITD